MHIELVTSVSAISANPAASRKLYVDALNLPLERLDGEYFATEQLEGVRHFGVWPLAQAAQACFGTDVWPKEFPIPQVSIEFELRDIEALIAGVQELESGGFKLLHGAKTEPWGQTVARLLTVDGVIVGLSYAPSLHENSQS
ncbi:MAG: glyoxalase [Betaproteobacteria bacterium]|nr:glyoxalase [Betaproteobacteria bacterium]